MNLRTAFTILKPREPSYRALNTAHETFKQHHQGNEEILQLGQIAKACLLEKDVYWFCPDDFARYTEETASIDMLAAIQQRLTAVRALGLRAEVRGSWVWIVGDVDGHRECVEEMGFAWRKTTRRYGWSLSELNDDENTYTQ